MAQRLLPGGRAMACVSRIHCLHLQLQAAAASQAAACQRWRAASSAAEGGGGGSGALPPELQDLCITEDGQLIDQKTGKAINAMGATRFDVAVRAMRGEFDVGAQQSNTERDGGLLMESLVQFPCMHSFNFVARLEGGSGSEAEAAALAAEVQRRVGELCEAEVEPQSVGIKQRLGGKYVSLSVPVRVRAAQQIQQVLRAFEGDERFIMKY